jgi:hypothetical protein
MNYYVIVQKCGLSQFKSIHTSTTQMAGDVLFWRRWMCWISIQHIKPVNCTGKFGGESALEEALGRPKHRWEMYSTGLRRVKMRGMLWWVVERSNSELCPVADFGIRTFGYFSQTFSATTNKSNVSLFRIVWQRSGSLTVDSWTGKINLFPGTNILHSILTHYTF